jgi:hypothetical protein
MTHTSGDSSASPKMHHVIIFQLTVSISCAILIVFSKEWPDTLIGTAVHWWIEWSAGAIRILLFFEPWPSMKATKNVAEGMRAHRHVLAMSLLIAFYSTMASRPYWPHWSATLSAKLKRAGYGKAKRVELAVTGYRRMVVAAAAMVFLALFGGPQNKEFIERLYLSDWALFRAPLLIGVSSAFVLLAATFRRNAYVR